MIKFLTVPDPNDPGAPITAKNITVQQLGKFLIRLNKYALLVEQNQDRATLGACAAMAREGLDELKMLVERLEVHERKNLAPKTRRIGSAGRPRLEPDND